MKTKTLKRYISDLKNPRRDAFVTILNNYSALIYSAKGLTIKHQAWDGGYADHLT